MSWLKDPESQGNQKIGLTYRLLRRFNRSLMSVWFRELDIVDNEKIVRKRKVVSHAVASQNK